MAGAPSICSTRQVVIGLRAVLRADGRRSRLVIPHDPLDEPRQAPQAMSLGQIDEDSGYFVLRFLAEDIGKELDVGPRRNTRSC
jgi:hypothetical protein